MEPSIGINKRMSMIGIELLTKAALCAAMIALVAGLAAALLFRTE